MDNGSNVLGHTYSHSFQLLLLYDVQLWMCS